MYNNVGMKVKGVAVAFGVIGFLSSVLIGLSLISNGNRYNNNTILGISVIFGGSLSSWISSLILYGFGQLIDDTAALRDHFTPSFRTSSQYSPSNPVNNPIPAASVVKNTSSSNHLSAKQTDNEPKESLKDINSTNEMTVEEEVAYWKNRK